MKRLIVASTAFLVGLAVAETTHAAVMFYADAGNVYRANMDGSGVTRIHDVADGSMGWVDVDPIGQKVYLRGSVAGGGVVLRMNYDGSGTEVALSGMDSGGYGFGIDVAHRTMYFGDYPGGIYIAELDGSDLTLLPNTKGDYLYGDVWDNPNLRHTHDMEVVGNTLYYSNDEHTTLSRHSHLFEGIRRSNLDGTNVETLVDYSRTTMGFTCLAIDQVNSKLYWSEDATDSIYRANLDGTNAETFLTGISAYDLEIDAASQMLYFTTSWDSSYLGRIGLDGTGLEQLVVLSGVDGAKGLALLTTEAVPEPASLAVWSILCVVGFVIVRRRRRHA